MTTSVNEAACRMLEASESELHGKLLAWITHPDDRDRVSAYIEKLRRREISSARLPVRYKMKRSGYVEVDLTIAVIAGNDAEELLVCMFQESVAAVAKARKGYHPETLVYLGDTYSDTEPLIERPLPDVNSDVLVAEQQFGRERLESLERELQGLMDALDQSSLVSIADKNGKILKVNKRFCEVAKYKESELVGQHHNIVNAGYHSKEFWKDFWTTIKKGDVWRGEIKNRAKDGTEYWVNTTINPIRNEKGEVVRYLSIRQDITSRKRYEQLLLESNLRLAQIEQFIDFTTDAIQVSNLEGQFAYINQMASQRLGISRAECHKYNITDVETVFNHKSAWKKNIAQLKQCGYLNSEGSNMDQSTGVLFPVEVTMRLISIQGKDFVIVVSRDITERKKNEMALRENQTRLAEAQRMAKLGYWEFDLTTNTTWWSDEQYNINGVTKTDTPLSQDYFLGLLHPDDLKWFKELLHKVISEKSETSATYRIVRPDGEIRVISGYSNTICDQQGNVVKLSGVNQDITEFKMTEKALRESEETLRKAQSVAKIGSWKLDVKTGLLEWSDETYSIFGLRKGKPLTYTDFLSCVHPEDKEFVDSSWRASLTGAPYDIVHRIVADGKVKWVREQAELTFDEFNNLIYGFGIVQDFTDHKILQDSNLIFNQSLLLTGLGSWRVSFKNKDLFLSDNIYNLHGLQKEQKEITLDSYLQLIAPADRAHVRAVLKKLLREKGSFETEYRVQKSAHETRWLSAKGKMLTDPDGKPVEIYGIVRDITSEKNSTAELIKARKEAEEASFIKDEFLSVMSHEIRTPLNSVIGLSNLILKRNPREDQLEIMKVLKGSADNLLHLVNDILDFNKIRAGKLELEFIPFRLTVFLQHLYASFRLSAHDKNIDFTIHTDARIPDVVIGDVTRLNQIFNNLIGNAIKFTDQGYVKFKVDLKSMKKNTCTLVFHIEDTGVGITSDKLETIFQPFQQSESDITRKYGGTGLGLSIVNSLLEILKGNIRVNSTPGKGSVFSVELSLKYSIDNSEELSPAPPATIEESAVKFRKYLRILYVEDVESNRFLIENLLAEHGISTTTASCGRIALQFARIERFDLILMDIQMPGMDGYETTRKIRSQRTGKNKHTPVLAFTAEPYSEELKKKVSMHDIQDVISKPFDAGMLLEKIYICVESRSNEQSLFSFAFYEKAFNFDPGKLRKIIVAVTKDVERFRTKMLAYDKRKNWKKMSDEIHRIRPIFRNLECDHIVAILDTYKNHDGYNPDVKNITRILVSQLNMLLKQLSKLKY